MSLVLIVQFPSLFTSKTNSFTIFPSKGDTGMKEQLRNT